MGREGQHRGIMTQAPNSLAQFTAAVANVKTMADGAPRFTFDAGENAASLLSVLAECQQSGRYLQIVVFDAEEWAEYVQGQ